MRADQAVRLILVLLTVGVGPRAEGDEAPASADKSAFTLFNPTPKSLMRDFVTDRPNATEGPFTVDAGHVQVEFSFVEYTYDRDHGVRTDGFAIMPANLRVGILNDADLQLIINPYDNVRSHGEGTQRNAGFGNTTLRATVNLWGNDGGNTAFGLIPFLTFPTGTDGLSNHHVEGGLILPLDLKLSHGFDLGVEMAFAANRNDRNDGYGVDFEHTVSLGHSLFSDKLNGYAEYVGISSRGAGQTYLAYFDTGLTYALSENVQLDAGINIGLSRRADDFTIFTGASFRF